MGISMTSKEAAPSLFGDDLAEMPERIVVEMQEIYNEFADRVNAGMGAATWIKCLVLTKARRTRASVAAKDYGGVIGFRRALESVLTNDFLLGYEGRSGTHKTWKPDLGFFLQEKTIVKILEGSYAPGRGFPTKGTIAQQAAADDQWGRFLRDYRPKGFWPPNLGPRPEDPACRAPREMLEACRNRLGIVVTVPPKETREDRLRATIVSYRKIGRYEDANRVERELAVAEGRPPVEVPAPDARDPDNLPTSVPRRPIRSRADDVSSRMNARINQHIPPEYDGVPEADYEIIDGED